MSGATAGRPLRPRHRLQQLFWVVGGAVALVALATARLDWHALGGFWPALGHFLRLMFAPPAWKRLPDALAAMLASVQMAWIGTLIGIIVAFPLSFLGARGIAPRPVRLVVRALLGVLRAVPEVVIAILMLSVTGLTPFTGALALGIGSIGTLGKWGYETFEAIDARAADAVRAAGGGGLDVIRWGVWTAAQPELLSLWLYRFEINVRASAILGLIGAGGIGKMLSDNAQFRNWDVVGMLFLVVVAVTMIIDQLSGMARQRLVTGRWALPTWRRTHAHPVAE